MTSNCVDVVVVGAGLSGLNAATLLEAAGLRVSVVEARNRIGGRLHTLDELPGQPEAGAVQIGSGYRRIIELAQSHGVPLVPGGTETQSALYLIGGRRLRATEWPDSSANSLSGAERAVEPGALPLHFARQMPALSGVGAWREADAIASLDMPYAEMLHRQGASQEASRLIEANLNGNGLATLSALNIARTVAVFQSSTGPLSVIANGSQRLPEAMAKSLDSPPLLGWSVARIEQDRTGVTLTSSTGDAIWAAQVIVTVPFSVVDRIEFRPALPQPWASVIEQLPYTRASFVFLKAETAFWQDGDSSTLWTDDPLVGRVFAVSDDPPLLKAWIAGPSADLADRMNDHAIASRIIAAVTAARPAAEGKLSLLTRFSWGADPLARGIYHHLAPGTATPLAAFPLRMGDRIYFAGEHLARHATGMEGALESGETAARMLLRRTA